MPDKYKTLREAATKATPGEWSVGPAHTDDEGYIELPIYSVVNGKKVAPMAIALQFPYVRGMQEANADLVVLAHNLMPTLLAERDALREALQMMVHMIEQLAPHLQGKVYDHARAALTK